MAVGATVVSAWAATTVGGDADQGLAPNALQMLSDLALFRRVPIDDLVRVLSLGVVVSLGVLLLISGFRAFNAAAIWLAAVRVEALAAQCGLPHGEALTRPFLRAFRHSGRLRRLAQTYLRSHFSGDANVMRRDGRGAGGDEARTSATAQKMFPDASASTDSAMTATFNYFPAAVIALGGTGLIALVAVNFLGAKAEALSLGDRVNIPLFLHAIILCAMFAAGCGLTGLLSPAVRWLVTAMERRNCQRLQWAVADCMAAAAALKDEQTRLLKEMSRFLHLLEEEPRARARHATLVNDAVANVERMIRISRENGGAGGDGMASVVRELVLDVARLQDRIEVALAQQSSLILTDGALSAISDFRASLDRLTAASNSIRESSHRLTSIVDSIADITSAVIEYVKNWDVVPVETDTAASHPAIAELNEIMKEFNNERALLQADSRDDKDEL